MSTHCDGDIFRRGVPVLVVYTGPQGGAAIFETWVKGQSDAIIGGEPACAAGHLTRVVDWHYSGGRAQVIVHADSNVDAVRAYLASKIANSGLPKGMSVLAWLSRGESLYRANVDVLPEGTIAVSGILR